MLVYLGDFAETRARLSHAIDTARAIGTRIRLGHAYLHLADLSLRDGDPEQARTLAEQGIAIGEDMQDPYVQRVGQPIRARSLLALHMAEAAAEAAQGGLAAARASGLVLDVGRNLTALGRVHWALGDGELADVIAQQEKRYGDQQRPHC